MRPEHTAILGCVVMALTMLGCDDGASQSKANKPAGEGGGETTTAPPAPTVARSDKAQLRFKRDLRLRNDFAAALGLEPGELCLELGQYDCVDEVHGVALGGLSAYDLGINEPAAETGVTAPLVVERIALAACAERSSRDFAAPSEALIYRDLPLDEGGTLKDRKAPEVADAITTLYRRVVLRNPSAAEREHQLGLYDDIATASEQPARDWATLSCFSVLTSTESLFY